MRRELTIQVVEHEEVFDFIAPAIGPLLGGASLLHHDSNDEAREWLHLNTPDLLFCDWEAGGAQLLRELRGREEGRFTPVVVTSSSLGDKLIADAVRGGASAVLAKPFSERELRDTVQRITSHLEQRHNPRVQPSSARSVKVVMEGIEPQQLELIDLSRRGCRLRAPDTLNGRLAICSDARLGLEFEGEELMLSGRLLRQEYDPAHRDGAHLLLAFAFEPLGDEHSALLDQLLAEL